MADLLLGVKIGATGGPQTVRQIKAIDAEVKKLQDQNKRAAETAKALSQAYDLSDAEVDQLVRELVKLEQQTEQATTSARGLNSVFQGIAQGFGQQLTRIGFDAFNRSIATVRNTVAGSISSFVEFEGALRQAGAISQSLGTPAFEALATEIERLGIVTSKTPIEIANTAVSLSRAGFSAEETAVALEGIARASEATGEALETVGDITAKTIRAFGLAADQSLEVANILVATANNTNTTISGLGESLKFLAPTAAAANQSLGSTAVLLGILGDAGIQGSQAGTNLAAALDRLKTASAGADSEFADLVRGNKKATQAFNLLSASVRGSDGQVRDLLEVIPEIQAGLANLSSGDQDLVLKALFGIEGGRAFQTIANASVERIQDITEEVKILSQQGEGAAVRTGTQLLQGLAGSLNLIGGSIDTLRNQLGAAFAPGLEGAVRLLTDIINQIIEAGDAFTAIEDAGTRFTQALQANPQIATQLAIALGDVARIISEGIAAQLDNVTNALQTNPQLVQNLANNFVAGAQRVGEFVGALSRVAGALAKIGATAGGVGGSLLGSLVPTFTALVNVINAAVQSIQPLTNNTALLEAAFQALLIKMVAIQALAVANTFQQITAAIITFIANAAKATVAANALAIAQANGASTSALLGKNLLLSGANANSAVIGYIRAAQSAAAVAAKFALLAGAIAAVTVALTRFQDGGADLRKGADQINQQLVQTQLELKRTLDATNQTSDALTDLFPKEPPPTDFLDGVTARLVELQDRIAQLKSDIPGLGILLNTIPGGQVLNFLPTSTNAEKRLNDQKIALDELIAASNRAIASTQKFDGVQSQAVTQVQNLDVAIQALQAQQQALNPGEIGTDAYQQFTEAIELNIAALEREKIEFQRRFGLVDSFSDLVDQNRQALQQIATDTQNANAKLLEEGGSQRDILLAEKKGYEDRIAESRRFAAQLQNALEAQILDPEDVNRANQEILNAESAAADARLGIARVNQDIADLVTNSVDEQVKSLKGLTEANSAALQQLQIDATLAKVAVLESGGGQEEIAKAEKQALKDRLATNREFLTELQELQKGQTEGSEDAIKTAEQIKTVEQTIANDRLSLLQQIVDAARKAAEARAKAETDALKKTRDEEKRIATERQQELDRQAQREFDDARAGRSEARDAQRRAEDRAFQQEQQASDLAFQEQRRASDRAFQRQQQDEAQSFQQAQQAAARSFQRKLDAERQRGGREFDVLTSEVERRIQLQQAADAQSRRALQEQFREEDRLLKRRREVERQVLRERGQVLGQRREETQLGPLEQARQDFEEQLQARQQAFQESQQAAAQAFAEQQAAEEEARRQAQQAEDLARAEERQQIDDDRAELRRQEDKAFAEQERALQDAFEAQQRDQRAAFNEQQRQLDEASASRIAAILDAAKVVGIDGARRDGGTVLPGRSYLVGEAGPELITPSRRGWVQTAGQTAAIMGSAAPTAISFKGGGVGRLEQQMDMLLKEVRQGRRVQPGGNVYNLSTPSPIQDAAALEVAKLRQLTRARGL